MQIIRRSEARTIKRQTPGAYTFPYCTGKYKWNGSEKSWLGKDVGASSDLLAVYVERRQDVHGAYAKMMCVLNRQPE
jgi:hypothetical protein